MNTSGRHQYQDPRATMTLREGLEEYRAAYPYLIDPDSFTDGTSGELFACHDPCHILFGTNTDLMQEGMTDMWTVWGTDIGFSGYIAYMKAPEARETLGGIIRDAGAWHMTVEMVRGLPQIWRVWRHSRRMTKPWTFRGWRDHLDRPLSEIRREFGIELVKVG